MPGAADVTAFAAAKVHHRAGRLAEAERLYRAVLEADPGHHDCLHLLGVLAHQCGDSGSAEKLIRGAIALCPDAAAYHNHLGIVLQTRDTDEAEAEFRRAIALAPQLSEAHANLGSLLLRRDRAEEAVLHLNTAHALAPADAEIAFNLGNAMRAAGRHDDAMAAYQAALATKPDHAEAHVNLGLLLLAEGRFAEGGAHYDWRPSPAFDIPEWDGKSDRTVLLQAEQGLGDTIQFCRFAPLAAQRSRRAILQVPASLKRLLTSLRVGVVTTRVPTETHCRLMSLPWRLGAPALAPTMPYLTAEPALVEAWRARLPRRKRLRIGISWQGNPKAAFDRARAIPLAHFAALQHDNVELIALQKHHGLDQTLPGLTIPEHLDEGPDAFIDTAALMRDLDFIVTCDSAVAHLAGALARPAWMALPFAPDWRWELGHDTTPWYPTMRLFRQTSPGDWSGVFTRMATTLQNRTTPDTS